MKLRNLLCLLLALSLFFVGCSNESAGDKTNNYYMEKELVNCIRIGPILGLTYQFMLMFESKDNSIAFYTTLYIDESETVLKSGTYTSADGSLDNVHSIFIVDTGKTITLQDATGTAVVDVDGDNYKMDFLITDATQKSYHFTYEGAINDLE